MSGSQRLAISGGTGYVGGRLVVAALAAGWQVRVLSRQAKATVPAGADLRVVDWNDAAAAEASLDGCDVLLQLAASNEADAGNDPVGAIRQTTQQAMAWLEAARRSGVPRLMQFSTAHVYGVGDAGGSVPESAACRPRHPYAAAHLAAEECVRMAHRRGSVQGAIVRLANAVGAPAHAQVRRWTLLANDLCRQAAETGRMQLHSDGTAVRDFVALTDVCGAVLHLLSQSRTEAEALTVNLGGDAGWTVWELAQRLHARAEALYGSQMPLERRAPLPGAADVAPERRFRLDMSSLRGMGWVAQAGALDAELDGLLRFCRAHFRRTAEASP